MASRPPNILVIMSDEHAPQFSGAYGHPLVMTPHLDRLARGGTLFESAYCNSPLCVPSRMSFMTGRYVNSIGTFDNASPLGSDEVTWAHTLRAAGYDVALAGKQHFVGPDQLHGFRAQLARDLHAEMDHPLYRWDDGIEPPSAPWGHLDRAGPGSTVEIETDDGVEAAALDFLHDPARGAGPWALNASFIAPHFPFVVPDEYWDLYDNADIDLPVIPPGHLESQHEVYQRLRVAFGLRLDVGQDVIRRARVGYYGLITQLDRRIGRLLDTLDALGFAQDTFVVYTSDHGEMNGEHGLWRKSTFYEQSVRVPLVIRWPGRVDAGRRVAEVVSLVDLVATLIDVADTDSVAPLHGDSVLGLASGSAIGWKDEAFAEYLAHGVTGPMAMLRRGRYKLNYSHGDPLELYDLDADPGEMLNIAADPAVRDIVAELRADLLARWDPVALDDAVRQSQRDRHVIRLATSGVG